MADGESSDADSRWQKQEVCVHLRAESSRGAGGDMDNDDILGLVYRSQRLAQDERGRVCWEVVETPRALRACETAMLICDMWDRHWSRGASERVEEMAPRMNAVIKGGRDRGVHIVHAPSETMAAYDGTPARQRMLSVTPVEPPPPLEHAEPPLPIDDSDGGSDTGETSRHKAWSCEHPLIEIDQGRDVISDDGQEVYSYLRQQGIRHLIIMGVHTGMCVLNRSFAIKRMVRWGVDVALARNLTDAMYNPAKPPYVSHDEGTRLLVSYIEKFWCPSVELH
jgi:nicotinamidase-related amidase